MRKLVPLHKQSKKQRKEYNAKQRGSWNGISPVTCLASKLTNIELSDICPLAKAGQPFEVARENTCEECKYFCRIHYEVDPEYGDKQVHFWMNEEIVTFF